MSKELKRYTAYDVHMGEIGEFTSKTGAARGVALKVMSKLYRKTGATRGEMLIRKHGGRSLTHYTGQVEKLKNPIDTGRFVVKHKVKVSKVRLARPIKYSGGHRGGVKRSIKRYFS